MTPFTDAVLAPYPPAFRAAIQFIMGPSNDGHADDSAPGEAFITRWGITGMTWNYAASHGLVTGALADATPQQIVVIYSALFWRAAGCYRLEPAVGFMVFNDAVLCGTGHAARMLQRIVGAVEDGIIGMDTENKAWRFGVPALIRAIAAGDDAYFATLANAPKFLNGWTRREDEAMAAALKLAGVS